MRKVYLPFSSASRCALTDWYDVPAFRTCAFAPGFTDDARLELFEPGEIDRFKGRMIATVKNLLARAVAALAGAGAVKTAG